MNRPAEEHPLFCDRCVKELTPGRGDFYVVKIEAVADPSPPVFTEADLQRDHQQEMLDIFRQLAAASERELVDEVHRRLTLYLCAACFREWIENPV